MSDRIEDVVRACQNVADGTYPWRIGLLPIPKNSKYRIAKSGMWSTAFDVLLTTLRYLAPATILTLFWGHHHSFFILLKHIDRAIRTVIFSSNAQKETVLRWLSEASSVQVDDLNTLWKNGWLLCKVLDAALPGACAGHPSGELTLKHAQTLVEQYLGVEPIFTDAELNSTDSLSRNQEWRLAHYLSKICEAIENLPPAVSKPNSQCNSPDSAFYTLDYAARGLGLSAAQVNHKMHFKLYPTAQQSLDPADITIFIRGPKDAYGMALVPPVLGKAQQIRQAIINSQKRPQYTENTLPTTLGATYLRNYGKTDMAKTYHIPRAKYDIEIEVESKSDHVKVDYVLSLEGKYEISITSKGQNVIGSPFLVTASHNILGTLERESFCLEDGDEVDILDVKNDRKVVLRIVDFVTEKMLLREDGALEKITDEEANNLMGTKDTYTNIDNIKTIKQINNFDQIINKLRFRDIAMKVALLIRICKIFASNVFDSKKSSKGKYRITKQPQLGIPDIVNSTLNVTCTIRPHYKNNNHLKTAPLSSQVEKQKQFYENIGKTAYQSKEKWFEIKDMEKDLTKVISTKNPFIEELENLRLKRQVSKEDEPIKIIVENPNSEGSSPNTNPFIEAELLERPKTPILKIITGNIQDRDDSIFVDPNRADADDPFCVSEFINPFFVHKHHETSDSAENITDFKIGALVSIPPTIQPLSADGKLESLMFTSKEYNLNTSDSMAFVSLDSNVSEDLSDIKFCNNSRINNLCYPSQASKRDLWDSAYVSIDENNSSPDVSNKDSPILIDSSKKQNQSLFERIIPTYEEFFKLGPAEKELWDSCDEIRQAEPPFEDSCVTRWDSKRLVFTPILEENERSMSAGWNLPDNGYPKTVEPVIVAITEQHNVYLEQALNSGHSSVSYEEQDKSIQSVEVDLTTKVNDVDSASDIISDVKRQTNEKTEGKISEVQFDSTESGSASQCLQNDKITLTTSKMSEEDRLANIVWEKKKFWDEKIRQIKEIESSEQKNIKSPKRNVQNNAFSTKRKPNNLGDDNPNSNTATQNVTTQSDIDHNQKTNCVAEQNESLMNGRSSDEKLVDKWKKYWDEKLEHEQQELYESGIRSVSPKFREASPLRTFPKTNLLKAHKNENTSKIDTTCIESKEHLNSKQIIISDSQATPAKRDLPDDIMFQAFETSPKRFFGTSRKQILSKIDSFIGKQTNPIQRSTSYLWSSNDKELVSRRVSVFQSISHEEMPFKTSKSKSMNNINQHSEAFDKTKSMLKEIQDKVLNSQHGKLAATIASGENITDSRDIMATPKLNTEEDLNTLPENSASDGKSFNDRFKIHKEETKTVKAYHKTLTNADKLRKQSLCKSEMDIFAKFSNSNFEDDFDKYKSCDDLPKINVKRFITLYEQNSSTPEKKVLNNEHITSNLKSKAGELIHKKTMNQEQKDPISEENIMEDHEKEKILVLEKTNRDYSITPQAPPRKKRNNISTSQESLENSTHTEQEENSVSDLKEIGKKKTADIEEDFDIEVEIVERPEMAKENSTKPKVDPDDYRLRFRSAKQFFQSIEELSPKRNLSPKFNECEELLQTNNIESQPNEILQTNEPKTKRKKEKSNSVSSSELAEAWNQMKENNYQESDKLVKISEKFNVDDLFVDVVEGKLSRQGSLRGIPNKKAVLETFRSMENVSNNLSPYHIATTQPPEPVPDTKLKNAQSYMKEYPYLPVTEPSKYHSRMDTKATGLMTMKELVQKKPRRNSEPEFILNPKFTVNM